VRWQKKAVRGLDFSPQILLSQPRIPEEQDGCARSAAVKVKFVSTSSASNCNVIHVTEDDEPKLVLYPWFSSHAQK
jgi:hypothetical protein